MNLQGNYTVTLIPGDGIGPEIADSVKKIFKAAQVCLMRICMGEAELTFNVTGSHCLGRG